MQHPEVRGHAPEESLDGRVMYPTIAVYEWTWHNGAVAIMNVPPQNCNNVKSYKTLVHDLAAYDELSARGFWHSEAHTGISAHVVDERKAPGA